MQPRDGGFGDDRAPFDGLFDDRVDAGAQLAAALESYRKSNPLVLGIPRGGVPIAYEIAKRLGADLDVIVVRKIGAPGQEELAIGAVASDGTLYVDAELQEMTGVSDAELARLTEVQSAEARRREVRFRAGLPALHPEGRITIVADDGLATGSTMRAAIASLRRRGAERIVVAVPVGSAESCRHIGAEVDDLVCLYRPEPFYAVGQHYRVFEQTSDEEVERLLRGAVNRPAPPA